MNVRVSPTWLSQAWYGRQTFKTNPICSVANGQIKITVFRENAVGMRSMTTVAQHTGTGCFEIPNSMRAYIHHLQFAKDIVLKVSDQHIEIVAEQPSFAIQYRIDNVKHVEDVHIEPSNEDVALEIGTEDWFHICMTMPQKGILTFDCRAQKRMVTVKHSKNRWGAAIMAREKAPATASFRCRADVVRFCFKSIEQLPAFGTLIFMKCGVLKWQAGFTHVFLAPHE